MTLIAGIVVSPIPGVVSSQLYVSAANNNAHKYLIFIFVIYIDLFLFKLPNFIVEVIKSVCISFG